MRKVSLLLVCVSLLGGVAVAQEHWTEGPVWACSSYRTKPGQYDNYLEYLRKNYAVTAPEEKKAGLVLDSKIFVKAPATPVDWDVLICDLYSSYGKAMDYSAEDDAKGKEIAAAHYKTSDEDQQEQMSNPRFEMREYLGTDFVREVNLKPIAK